MNATQTAIIQEAERIGARVHATAPRESDGATVVMASTPGRVQQYVTWLWADHSSSLIWGHYYSDELAACRDFNRRTDDLS